MEKVLHVSLSDIRSDSRIIKSMRAAFDSGFHVSGIGIKHDDVGKNASCASLHMLNIESLDLFFRKFRKIPAFIRHMLSLIEFYARGFVLIKSFRPDIVHCNDVEPLLLCVFAKKLFKFKIIYDAHELESEKNGLSSFMQKLIFRIEKFSWRSVDGLIVVSPSIEKWYENKLGYKPARIVMNSPVYSGFENLENKKYFHKKYNIDAEKKILLYIGAFLPGRGLEIVGRLAAIRNDCHVVYLGYGSEIQKLKELEDKYQNIHVHDAVEHDQVVPLAKSADIGLCLIEKISLSDYYCLPNKLFEYSFSQLPVLATNFPDISNLVEKFDLGVTVDLIDQSIDRGLSEVIENYSAYKSSYDKVDLSVLSWEQQAKKIIDLYSLVFEEK